MCIFVFTALIYCTLCSDCSHIFVSFQTFVGCFCDRVSSSSPLFLSPKHPYMFFSFFIIYIIITNFFRRVFSEFTTSLTPLETILPEECAFIIGFNCTMWTKMRSFALSIADSALFKFLPTHQIRKVRGRQKSAENPLI